VVRWIGASYGGGIIAYIFQDGDPGFVGGEIHGLIVAPTDQPNAPFGCHGDLTYGTLTDMGAGMANTKMLVDSCLEQGTAARICYDLELNGYDDWFLPSKWELSWIEYNYESGKIGEFPASVYWTSSDGAEDVAYSVTFEGNPQSYPKHNPLGVRPVRQF